MLHSVTYGTGVIKSRGFSIGGARGVHVEAKAPDITRGVSHWLEEDGDAADDATQRLHRFLDRHLN